MNYIARVPTLVGCEHHYAEEPKSNKYGHGSSNMTMTSNREARQSLAKQLALSKCGTCDIFSPQDALVTLVAHWAVSRVGTWNEGIRSRAFTKLLKWDGQAEPQNMSIPKS